VTPWVAGLQLMIDAAERARDMNLELLASIDLLNDAMAGEAGRAAETAAAQDAAASAAGNAAEANAENAAAANANADAADRLTGAEGAAAAGAQAAASRINDMRDAALEAQAVMDRLEYAISSTAAASVAASALAGPAMDQWRDAITEASVAAEMAETRIDALADVLAESGEDAVAAAAGLTAYAAAEDEAAAAAARWEVTQATAIAMADTLAALERGEVLPAMQDAADATNSSRVAFGRWGITLTALHWIISGSAELLAVTLPAAIAASAAAFVLYQGAIEEVGFRLDAMYGATEATAAMINKTTGDVLGLGHAFQTAQNQANPIAYELLGSYLNAARSHMVDLAQAGLSVDQALAELGARIDVDFRTQGASLNSLLANMVSDLIEIGQVFGNVGHAILNLAADMPGLAEVLLAVVDGASRLLLVLSSMPGIIISVAMGIEEFMRWGGLLVTVLGKLGFVTQDLGEKFLSMERLTGILQTIYSVIPQLIFGFASLAAKIPLVGEAVIGTTEDIDAAKVATLEWIGSLSTVETLGIGALAIGFGYLAYKILNTKTVTQEWAASMQKAVASASNVNALAVITSNMAQLSRATEDASTQMAHASMATQVFSDVLGYAQSSTMIPFKSGLDALAVSTAGFSHETDISTKGNNLFSGSLLAMTGPLGAAYLGVNHLWDSFAGGVSKSAALSKSMLQMQTDMRNLVSGGEAVSRAFGGNLAEGWALAQAAGVNLSTTEVTLGKNANIAGQEIENLVAGYRAMDQVGGTLNNDMAALAAQAGLADTKVSGLNQAWDQFLQNATGLTSGFAGLVTDIGEINNAITTSGKKFETFGGAAVSSTTAAAMSMQSFSGVGAQVWQNYDAALQQAQTYTDNLRIAATTGAVSQRTFTQQIAYAVQQMLPYAQYSKAVTEQLSVLAQEAGGKATSSYKTLKAWVDKNTESSKKFMQQTTAESGVLSNATAVAQSYASTLNSEVAAALESATIASSNLTKKAEDLDNAWTQAGGHISGPVVSAFQQLVGSLTKVYGNTKTAEAIADSYARAMGATQAQVNTLNRDIEGYIGTLHQVPAHVNTTITTDYVNIGTPGTGRGGILPTPSGHQAGAAYVGAGVALVGERGPELVHFAGGESVTPSWMLGGMLGDSGGGHGTLIVHNHVNLDGNEIFGNQQSHAYEFNRRNGLTVTGSFAPPG